LLKEENSTTLVDVLFLAVLTRSPAPEESRALVEFLSAPSLPRERAIGQAIWALICSTEFCVNH
jgi:hypothetical protein